MAFLVQRCRRTLIAQQLVSGSYILKVDSTGGAGTYTLTTTVAPTTAVFQPLPVGNQPVAIVAGDFTGNDQVDLAVAFAREVDKHDLGAAGQRRPARSRPGHLTAVRSFPSSMVAGDFTGNGILDLIIANNGSNNVSVLLGNGDGTFQPQVTYAVGSGPFSMVAGDFTGSGGFSDLAVWAI